MSKGKKVIAVLIAVFLLGIALGVAVFFLYENTRLRNAAEPSPAVENMPEPMPTVEVTPSPEPTPEPTPTPPPYVPPEELLEYQQRNEHVVALLDIPGTSIHYPILMHPQIEDYYLNTTIDGYVGYPGSIYINPVETDRFDTFNTVIYGHNMSDGSMFGTIKDFEDPAFMETHREIHIYTDTEEHVYTIAAIVIYDDRHITYTYDDDNIADRAAFLQSLQGADWVDGVEVDTSSHIITLSTCIGGMPENRRLLIAVEQEARDPDVVVVLPVDGQTFYSSENP
ncbi:MAG: class B sortase [Oscillospiraceae bacterium]|nr:class B sortase [Oscillospiraceae bacterium]